MNRSWIAALPLLAACDDLSLSLADDDASETVGGSGDVLVVHFEVAAHEVERPTRPPLGTSAIALLAREATSQREAIAATAAELESARRGAARYVVHEGRLVIAHDDGVSPLWSLGAPRLTTASGPDFRAERPVLVQALPDELRTLPGREVKVFDREREVCVARVSDNSTLRLSAALVHEATDQEDSDGETPTPITYTGGEVFERGAVSLSVALEPLIGDCTMGLWALPLAAPTPTLFREVAAPTSLRRRALAAFRALPEWRQAQHDMVHFYDDAAGVPRPTGHWDELDGARPTVRVYRSQEGTQELVVVSGDSVDGCGSPGQRLAALLRVQRDDDGPRLETLGAIPWGTAPSGLVDIEGDGTIEVFAASAPEALVLERWHALPNIPGDDLDRRVESLDTFVVPDLSWYGCGC